MFHNQKRRRIWKRIRWWYGCTTAGMRRRAALSFGLPVQEAFATDLLEEEMVPLPVENTRLPLCL